MTRDQEVLFKMKKNVNIFQNEKTGSEMAIKGSITQRKEGRKGMHKNGMLLSFRRYFIFNSRYFPILIKTGKEIATDPNSGNSGSIKSIGLILCLSL